MNKKNILLVFVMIGISSITLAQVQEHEILTKDNLGNATFLKLKDTKITNDINSIESLLYKQYNLDRKSTFKETKSSTKDSIKTEKYQQLYNGLKIEYGEVVVSSVNERVKTINGKIFSIKDLNTTPSLTSDQALDKVLAILKSDKFAWQDDLFEKGLRSETKDNDATYKPNGDLVIIDRDLFDNKFEPVLVYKFDIYSLEPLFRDYVFVDANNGKIIFRDPIIKHVEGTASTRYSGTRTTETQQNGSTHRLRDYSRGNGIETYNLNRGTNYGSATDFTDNDNNWTSTEYNNSNKDNAALDAHWGSEKTYDYFSQKHGRNSYDGNGAVIRSYVHYGNNYENAFWDGQRMTYGDGGSVFDALTSIDVVAHELGHGVRTHTANLVYQNESGAINEGLSDIWGAMVEFYAAPEKQTYLIGEEIRLSGGSLRSMSNPNARNHPDTYQGTYWYSGSGDNGGVHTNSGVLNYWFYLLAEGGNGTNDIGNSFNVQGIGKEKASQIVYRAESVYFTSTTNYSQARELTIQAAEDLFGENSEESYNVANAWYAVGIGYQPAQVTHFITGPTQLTPGYSAIYSMNPYSNATNYVWSIPSGCHYHYCWGIIQGQGTNTLSIKAGSVGVYDITCFIYNGNSVIGSQYITVNVQNPYGGGGGNDNPCGEFLTINGVIYPPEPCDTNGIAMEHLSIEHVIIYDFSGRSVVELKNPKEINLNSLKSGIYILKIKLSNNEIITKKIMR